MSYRVTSVFVLASVLSAGCISSKKPTTQSSTQPSTRPTNPSAKLLQKDLLWLASDDRDGRGIGTKGLDDSANFIAERFKALKLKPVAGKSDYFQPFGMASSVSLGKESALKLGDVALTPYEQFSALGISKNGDFSAPIVFAGYGITNPEKQYDDFAGIDVKGKVVLVLRYEPHNEKGTSRFADGDWSTHASLNEKADVAARQGAIAIILVNAPKFHPGDRLVPIARGGEPTSIPYVQIKQPVANELLKRAGIEKSLEALQTEIDTTAKPHSFSLNLAATGKVVIDRKEQPVKNVMAVLTGSKHPEEYVVVGAHYDHLGKGGMGSFRRNGQEVHNGADDNGSGTVAVLRLAAELTKGWKPERSILFVLFTGEEEGLIGSRHFVMNPPIPLEKIVGMLNLDMVGRVRNETLFTGGEGTAAAYEKMLADADKHSPLVLKSIGKGGFGPSDHQSFATKKIPVLFLFSGMHPDYHTPTDDPDKINYNGMAEVVELSREIVRKIAKLPRQQYVATFDSQGIALDSTGTGPSRERGPRPPRASLGVVPDYGTDEATHGVKITGTADGSPAAKAGVMEGDVIVQLGKKKIDNLIDLTEFLSQAAPGDKVTIVVEREKKRVELNATLAARDSQQSDIAKTSDPAGQKQKAPNQTSK